MSLDAFAAHFFMRSGIVSRIDSGNKPLPRRFFIAGRSVYLACGKKAGNEFCFECGGQLRRIDKIVFDRIAGARHYRMGKAVYRAQIGVLHRFGKRRRKSVQIHFVRLQAFRLDKKLVALTVGEPHYLIFDGRAIARPDPVDFSAVQRRKPDVFADNAVRFGIRVGKITGHHGPFDFFRIERKGLNFIVAVLNFQA